MSGGPATRPRAGSTSRDPRRRRPTGGRRRAAGGGVSLEGEGSGREAPARAASSRRHDVAAGCGQRSGRAAVEQGKRKRGIRSWERRSEGNRKMIEGKGEEISRGATHQTRV